MLNAQVILDQWNSDIPAKHYQRHGYHMVMQVHDELVFDFPKGADPVEDPDDSNLWRIKLIAAAMARGGPNLVKPVPTPVGIEYHDTSWAKGKTLA
jgi:hypothetical protein